ncbi:MAG: hypothetical protein DID92_2727743621 [Candidatus Nitrotoga sp. SPKER]|nr:MAG: hypothetical protein DID92_2727743621 [Candidatus Nitrotoga sp. SPKER]
MTRLFSFRGEVTWSVQRADVIFIYIPICEIAPSDIERRLVDQLGDGGISPDFIVFITPFSQIEDVVITLGNELLSERFDNLKRCKGIVLAPFNKWGSFVNLNWIKYDNTGVPHPDSNQLLVSARNAGFACLTGSNGVITKAPPGTYFRNPSQNPRSYFIRAALLCRNSVEASFVSFALLPLVAKAEVIYRKAPNIIWVDTVSIAYIAYALSELCIHLGALSAKPEIRSYSSYGGLSDTAPETGDYPIFLISASTSGGMARDLVARTGGRVQQEIIGTILGSFEEKFPQLLYSIPERQQGPNIESVNTLREILVSGEDFLFSPGEPIPVVLKRIHLPKLFSENFKSIQGKGLIHHFKRLSADKKPKAFFIDGALLAADNDFRHWVVSKAKGMLPGTVNRIVYQNDEGSRRMAEIVRDALKPFRNELPISSVEEIEKLPPQNDETVAIVAAVAGSGMELMRITKALRQYQPEGSRFFLIGTVLARSYMQLEQFKANLKLADKTLSYAVETWGDFATSTVALHEYHVREVNLLKEIVGTSDNTDLNQFAENRLDSIQAQGVVHEGLPRSEPFISMSGDDASFDLSKGFALWGNFNNRRCPIDVLFTVSCWLQNAREGRSLAHSERLDGGGFQQAIIAPDCFLRFTDPVIQVSILRCAHDSELDYRSSLTASPRAAEIISKFLGLGEESVTELLMALVLKRIRLRREDKDRVSAEAMNVFSDKKAFLHELARRYSELKE